MLVRRPLDGEAADLTPPPFNLRTRVHEYGGGAYAVRDGVVVAVEFADQRLYRLDAGGPARPLTPESGGSLCATPTSCSIPPAPGPRGARGPPVRRRAGQQHRACSPRRARRPGRELARATTSSALPASAPIAGSSPGSAGTTPTCRGTGPSSGSPSSAPDGRLGAARGGSPADRRSRSCSRNGRRTAGCYFVSDRTGWWNLYRLGEAGRCPSARWLPNSPGRPGASAAAGTASSTPTPSLPASPRPAAGIWRGSTLASGRPTVCRCPGPSSPGSASPAGRRCCAPARPTGRPRSSCSSPRAGRLRELRSARRAAGRPGLARARRAPVPERAGRERACPLLPADQPRRSRRPRASCRR